MSDWRPIGVHDVATQIDWNDPTLLAHCDPYLIWSDLNTQVVSGDPLSRISLIVEVSEAFDWEHESELGVTQLPWLANRRPGETTIVPCVVNDVHDLVAVIRRVGRDVLRLTLCRPRVEIRWLRISEQMAQVNRRREQPVPPPSPCPQGPCIVAVIDDGCAFLNERLRRPSTDTAPPRQISLLDQDRRAPNPVDPYWTLPTFPIAVLWLPGPPPVFVVLDWEGSHLERNAIRQLRGAVVPRNEANGYRAAGYLDPVPEWTHGHVVLDLAVGWPYPLLPPTQTSTDVPSDVIFVQLPRSTIADTSGGSLDSHALDALFYAALEAGATQWQAPVVANLSYGVYGKPHDGTSLFERAVVGLLNSPVGQTMELVLPAGNSHRLRTHAGGMLAPNRPRTLRWRIPADCTCESTLQIWLPLGNAVVVTIMPPDGSGPYPLMPGQSRVLKPGGELQCAGVHALSVADSLSLTMVFIGVSPTRRVANPPASALTVLGGNTAPAVGRATPGIWTIELVNPVAQPVRYDARIERGDVAPAMGDRRRDSGRRQAHFVEESRDADTACQTLNGIATAIHPRIHVVAAIQARDEQLSPYSSAGPIYQADLTTNPPTAQPLAQGPTKATVGDRSCHLRGVRAAGCLTRSIAQVDGTSVAAAIFTRMRARELSGGPPPNAANQPLKPPMFPTPEEPLSAPDVLRGGGVRVKP